MGNFQLTNNPGDGFAYLDETEQPTPDFDALFAEKPKRHKWGAEQFNGSRVAPLWSSQCCQCGTRRQKFYSFGERRLVYILPNGARSEGKALSCEKLR